MKNTMTMKKTYIRPLSQDLSFRAEGMLAASPGVIDSEITTGNKFKICKTENFFNCFELCIRFFNADNFCIDNAFFK